MLTIRLWSTGLGEVVLSSFGWRRKARSSTMAIGIMQEERAESPPNFCLFFCRFVENHQCDGEEIAASG